MPSAHHRVGWLIGRGGGCSSLSVWALASSALLVIATVVAYSLVRSRAIAQKLWRDLSVMFGSGGRSHRGCFAIASAGADRAVDYILTTIQSLI